MCDAAMLVVFPTTTQLYKRPLADGDNHTQRTYCSSSSEQSTPDTMCYYGGYYGGLGYGYGGLGYGYGCGYGCGYGGY
ncbi:hypothetical protein A6R68_10171, partial [Neotoma lepida]